MKKLILLSVAYLIFAGSQLSFAQTKAGSQIASTGTSKTDYASKKTTQIVEMLAKTHKLEGLQQKEIHTIFASVERKVKGIDAIEDASKKNAKRTKMQTYINGRLKNVLTDEQFKIYVKKTTAR